MANLNSLFGFSANQQPPGVMQQQPGMSGGGPDASMDRAQRSVFVGNIPYDATEEQLREVFERAGPVKSFRLVYDRESGKPKGYGFCEYQDVETAQSAMRNLNNADFNGRPLRVGVAAGEQAKDDSKNMQQAIGTQAVESPYGEPVEAEKAPEAISKAVASLPPEQMFELMKQMKLCIQNNPNEARNMLLQNPQLAYALLQAQIVMKIVDPQVAMSMLYRDETQQKVNMKPPGPSNQRPAQPHPPTMVQPPIPPPALQQQQPPTMVQPPRPPVDMGSMNQFPKHPQNMGPPRPGPSSAPSSVPPVPRPPVPPVSVAAPQPSSGGSQGAGVSSQDQEKAALIMQVLQLTDEQIALLPPEQRQSILILKEQIKSG